MDYFELFGLPVQLKVDKEAVKKKYFELSKKSHQDYFINSREEEQQQSSEASALLNKGLKTLSNSDETIAYVLKSKGLLQEVEKYQLPPEFLLQMMEVNEEVAAANFDDNSNQKIQLYQQ